MLKFENLTLRRGPRVLLSDVNLIINTGQKIGITGANGVGKSSLFALIRADIHPDAGNFTLAGISSIAYVAQETPAIDQAAIEYVLDGDQELRSIEQQIEVAKHSNDGHRLAVLYGDLEHINGYGARSKAATIMHGLGFTAQQELHPVKTFSGGWRMRLNLAQALMCRSDLLLLDEPTNHLDLDAVIWVEDWLRQYNGTLLLISHDRDFLDSIVTHIVHMEQQGCRMYTGNYSAFESQRAQWLSTQQVAYEKQQREIAHIHQFVDKFRAKATKAKQAQSRIKALERMEVISQAHIDSPFQFEFTSAEKIPDPLVTMHDVNVGYQVNDQVTTVLKNINLSIAAGARVGLLGPNGAGKSTFIKLLAGINNPQQGEVIAARDIKIGYFAQHQLEQLDSHASPLLHLQRIDARASESDLRKFLGGFAFQGDGAIDPIINLSGGEKARLALALLVYQRPNLLLLDEPTNHLDLEMRHALTVALQSFAGALIVVSHDRHLMRTTTDKFLLVADTKIDDFEGDLEDYAKWLQVQNKQDRQTETLALTSDSQSKKQLRQIAAQQRVQLQPLRTKLAKLEKELEKLTQDKSDIEVRLGDNDLYAASQKELLKELLITQSNIQSRLSEVEAQWLDISEELELQESQIK